MTIMQLMELSNYTANIEAHAKSLRDIMMHPKITEADKMKEFKGHSKIISDNALNLQELRVELSK